MKVRNPTNNPGRWCCRLPGMLVALIAGTLLLGLFGVGTARAHANLVSAQPPAGSVLPESPAAIVLDFSEELDPRAATVELQDAQSQVVVPGPGVIDASNPQRLQLALPGLPDGTYSAIWQVRSAVDGHTTNGSVAFAIGADALPPSQLPPPGVPDPATARPETADTLVRWLNYLAATVAVGSLMFGWLVWRPAYQRWESASPDSDLATPDSDLATSDSDLATTALLQRLARYGSACWALATLLFIVIQAMHLNSSSLGAGVLVIIGGRSGLLAGVRLGLLLLLVLLAGRLPPAGTGPRAPWLFLSLAGVAALLTISLQSHSAALPGTQALPATALDWLHLLAMATWLGGLVPLAVLLRPGRAQPDLAKVLVPRFSLVALPCIAILVLTGLYNSLTLVGTAEALISTTHGRALLIKSGLFLLLLGLGAANLLWLSPRLRRDEGPAGRKLGRTVRIELVLGTIVLLTVGVLTGVAPAMEALEAQQRAGFLESIAAENVQLTLRIAPLQLGNNEYAVDIVDERPGAAQVEPMVLLRFQSDNEDMGVSQVETDSTDGVRYQTRGAYLPVSGTWQVQVILRRAGFDDITHTFEVLVQPENHHTHGS